MNILDIGCGLNDEPYHLWLGNYRAAIEVREVLDYAGHLEIHGIDGLFGDTLMPKDFCESDVMFTGFALDQIPNGPYDVLTWFNPNPWDMSLYGLGPKKPIEIVEECIVSRLKSDGVVIFASDMALTGGSSMNELGVDGALNRINALFDKYLSKVGVFSQNNPYICTSGVYHKLE